MYLPCSNTEGTGDEGWHLIAVQQRNTNPWEGKGREKSVILSSFFILWTPIGPKYMYFVGLPISQVQIFVNNVCHYNVSKNKIFSLTHQWWCQVGSGTCNDLTENIDDRHQHCIISSTKFTKIHSKLLLACSCGYDVVEVTCQRSFHYMYKYIWVKVLCLCRLCYWYTVGLLSGIPKVSS